MGREWNGKQREDMRQKGPACAHPELHNFPLEGNLIGARQEPAECLSAG